MVGIPVPAGTLGFPSAEMWRAAQMQGRRGDFCLAAFVIQKKQILLPFYFWKQDSYEGNGAD